MADSGASISVLDETDYYKNPNRPDLKKTSMEIYGYQSKEPLHVLGKLRTTVESKIKIIEDKLYVVKASCGSLLSWKASHDLSLLQTVQQVTENSKPTEKPTELIDEYEGLFQGLGKLKNYQIKLHIDESVPPVAQPHRRVPFHVRKQLEEQLKRDEELGVIEWIEVDGETGDRHIVTYASRSLTSVEQRYSKTEREALAVHLYIYGKPVTVYTYHKPFVSIYNNSTLKTPSED
ncbi:hypothetical protein QZH41_000258 [Actinostola sp. cb2023]|nr:hypothetical protein QZH41_000258 [Actinostola sp. cb2023]